MNNKTKRSNQNKLNLHVDMGIFILFVVVSAPQATGVVLHEWLSFLFVVPILIHILLHWSWVKKVTGRFLRKLPGETRFFVISNIPETPVQHVLVLLRQPGNGDNCTEARPFRGRLGEIALV